MFQNLKKIKTNKSLLIRICAIPMGFGEDVVVDNLQPHDQVNLANAQVNLQLQGVVANNQEQQLAPEQQQLAPEPVGVEDLVDADQLNIPPQPLQNILGGIPLAAQHLEGFQDELLFAQFPVSSSFSLLQLETYHFDMRSSTRSTFDSEHPGTQVQREAERLSRFVSNKQMKFGSVIRPLEMELKTHQVDNGVFQLVPVSPTPNSLQQAIMVAQCRDLTAANQSFINKGQQLTALLEGIKEEFGLANRTNSQVVSWLFAAENNEQTYYRRLAFIDLLLTSIDINGNSHLLDQVPLFKIIGSQMKRYENLQFQIVSTVLSKLILRANLLPLERECRFLIKKHIPEPLRPNTMAKRFYKSSLVNFLISNRTFWLEDSSIQIKRKETRNFSRVALGTQQFASDINFYEPENTLEELLGILDPEEMLSDAELVEVNGQPVYRTQPLQNEEISHCLSLSDIEFLLTDPRIEFKLAYCKGDNEEVWYEVLKVSRKLDPSWIFLSKEKFSEESQKQILFFKRVLTVNNNLQLPFQLDETTNTAKNYFTKNSYACIDLNQYFSGPFIPTPLINTLVELEEAEMNPMQGETEEDTELIDDISHPTIQQEWQFYQDEQHKIREVITQIQTLFDPPERPANLNAQELQQWQMQRFEWKQNLRNVQLLHNFSDLFFKYCGKREDFFKKIWHLIESSDLSQLELAHLCAGLFDQAEDILRARENAQLAPLDERDTRLIDALNPTNLVNLEQTNLKLDLEIRRSILFYFEQHSVCLGMLELWRYAQQKLDANMDGFFHETASKLDYLRKYNVQQLMGYGEVFVDQSPSLKQYKFVIEQNFVFTDQLKIYNDPLIRTKMFTSLQKRVQDRATFLTSPSERFVLSYQNIFDVLDDDNNRPCGFSEKYAKQYKKDVLEGFIMITWLMFSSGNSLLNVNNQSDEVYLEEIARRALLTASNLEHLFLNEIGWNTLQTNLKLNNNSANSGLYRDLDPNFIKIFDLNEILWLSQKNIPDFIKWVEAAVDELNSIYPSFKEKTTLLLSKSLQSVRLTSSNQDPSIRDNRLFSLFSDCFKTAAAFYSSDPDLTDEQLLELSKLQENTFFKSQLAFQAWSSRRERLENNWNSNQAFADFLKIYAKYASLRKPD